MDSTDQRTCHPYGHQFSELVLTLGYRCNMKCKSCFIGEKLNDHHTCLSFEECVTAIESAAKLQSINSVAFVGGEPFVYYPIMLRLSTYLHQHYMCPLNVSTNATWSKTRKQTIQLLDPLYQRGLRFLLVSLDDYHLASGSIDHVANCLKYCGEIGVSASVQVINRIGAATLEDYRSALGERKVDVDNVHWYANPCSALGNAKLMLNKDELEWHMKIPRGGCSAGSTLNIQPDGEIKPCCGAGLMAPRLSLGNAKKQDVYEVVRRSEIDPIINSLIAEQGPIGLREILREVGRQDLYDRHSPFTDACQACNNILTDREILLILENAFEQREVEMLAQRILAVHGNKIIQDLHR